jgi:hypothetical protein
MIEDQISLVLKDIKKIRDDLRDIKKDIKAEEKLDTQDYLQIKVAFEDLKRQKKEAEESWKHELEGSDHYQKLTDMKLEKEEALAIANQKLFEHVAKLPQKPFQMDVQLDEIPVKVQIMPEMRLYLNGKEEKRRAAYRLNCYLSAILYTACQVFI